MTLPSKSNTCKFQDSRFSAKIHYIAGSITCKFTHPDQRRSLTCKLRFQDGGYKCMACPPLTRKRGDMSPVSPLVPTPLITKKLNSKLLLSMLNYVCLKVKTLKSRSVFLYYRHVKTQAHSMIRHVHNMTMIKL